MGYEVIYHYYEEIEKGEYNKEEPKQGSIKVGSPYEDIGLELLAGKIMALLARRNILVTDVEIYEFMRKQLSFRESDDGIVIKNKKFRFDDGAVVTGESVEETAESGDDPAQKLIELLKQNPQLAGLLQQGKQPPSQPHQQVQKAAQPAVAEGQVLRHEYYDPLDELAVELLNTLAPQAKLTKKKKYPILKEQIHPNQTVGMVYQVIDDAGKRIIVPERCFVNRLQPLVIGQNEANQQQAGLTNDGLSYGGVEKTDMPDLRGRK